jgi:hypothetical protein
MDIPPPGIFRIARGNCRKTGGARVFPGAAIAAFCRYGRSI